MYDASYHGLLVHRDYDTKTVKAKVLKVKFQNLVRTELKVILLGNLDLAVLFQTNL